MSQHSFALLDAFLAAGFNFVDTADVYSTWVPGHQGGESETIIGRWLKSRGNRHKVVIATKLGSEDGACSQEGAVQTVYADGGGRLAAAPCRPTISISTNRIMTTPARRRRGRSRVTRRLIRARKVRAIGASNFSAERLDEALDLSEKHGLPRYEALRPLYMQSL